MPEFSQNLWAPWRMEYIRSLTGKQQHAQGCFLCRLASETEDDAEHQLVWRGETCLTLFNLFPYTSGHLLVAPRVHAADLDALDDQTLNDLIRQIRDAKRLLAATLSPEGFNVGLNFGRCAGAGLPGHLHAHIVPRWDGDSNFMTVIGDVRVIPETIEKIHAQMRKLAPELGLPPVEE